MAVVNGDFSHYMDMKKFLKNFFLQNGLSDFEIISQECSLGDLFQKLIAKFSSIYQYGGFLHYEEILKKSCSQKLQVRF